MKKNLAPAITLLLALIGFGCKVDRLLPAKAEPAELFTTDVIARAALEVEARVGAPLRLLDLQAENGMIRFQVQDPKKPANVDQYEWRNGALAGPQPVKLIGGGTVEANLYPLAAVNLEKIPEFTRAAVAKLGIEDGKPTSIRVRIDEPADAISRRIRGERVEPRVTVRMYVDSQRRKGMVDGNARFEVVKSVVF
jgi:hypothetical protein